MKNFLLGLALLVLSIASGQERESIAIPPFRTVGTNPEYGELLADLAASEFSPQLKVVTRNFDALATEWKLSENLDEKKLDGLAAEFLMSGLLVKTDQGYHLSCKIVDLQSGSECPCVNLVGASSWQVLSTRFSHSLRESEFLRSRRKESLAAAENANSNPLRQIPLEILEHRLISENAAAMRRLETLVKEKRR